MFAYRTLFTAVIMAAAFTSSYGQLELGCFEATTTTGNCTQFASTFCNSLNATLVGPDNAASACFDNGEFICSLTAWNNRPAVGGNVPNVNNCITALSTVGDLCPQGGSGFFEGANFVFTLQPQESTCGATSAFP